MLTKMMVKSDGISLIGRIKQRKPTGWKVRGKRDPKSVKFDKYYYEGIYQGISDKDLPNYIQMRFLEEADDIIDDSIDDKGFDILYKNFQNRLHKRLVRYRDKLLSNLDLWNYFVTFTYDSGKESSEGFEKRLFTAFNNFAKRHGWKVIGGWERGELKGRLHFHAFIHVPEGEMVGELYGASRWSDKRHCREYYTENSYFKERFGMSDWVKIDRDSIVTGGLVSYLVKYVVKSGRKLFYSRGIKNEFEMEVDSEDILMSFFDYGVKHIIARVKDGYDKFRSFVENIVEAKEEDTDIFVFSPEYSGYCRDCDRLVRLYS